MHVYLCPAGLIWSLQRMVSNVESIAGSEDIVHCIETEEYQIARLVPMHLLSDFWNVKRLEVTKRFHLGNNFNLFSITASRTIS